MIVALNVVIVLNQKIKEFIKFEIKTGRKDREIINMARNYQIFSKTDIEEMIMYIKKQRLRNTLKHYYVLEDQKLGVTLSETFISNTVHKDIPEKLLIKIDIDNAIERLDEFPLLKQLLVMRYLEEISIEKIEKYFGFSKSKVYQLLDLAFERLVNLIEYGISQTLEEIRINRIVEKLTKSRVFDDSVWVRKIVKKMYKKAQINGYI